MQEQCNERNEDRPIPVKVRPPVKNKAKKV